jgi:hypothetical protein
MKDNKQRLFEMMQKVNPDFKINENLVLKENASSDVLNTGKNAVRNVAMDKQLGANFKLETYGNLKLLINVILKTQKGELVGSKIAGAGLDVALGLVPGLSSVKSLGGIISTMYNAPDTKKTNTWLDKLNIDDDLSRIVDDRVESGFLQDLIKEISGRADTDKLEPNFDINAKMNEYLQKIYNQRAISGVPPK